MRLKISRNAAEERLVACLNEGYELRRRIAEDYNQRHQSESFDTDADNTRYSALFAEWGNGVAGELQTIFPTSLECSYFCDEQSGPMMSYIGMDQRFGRLYHDRLPNVIERLRRTL